MERSPHTWGGHRVPWDHYQKLWTELSQENNYLFNVNIFTRSSRNQHFVSLQRNLILQNWYCSYWYLAILSFVNHWWVTDGDSIFNNHVEELPLDRSMYVFLKVVSFSMLFLISLFSAQGRKTLLRTLSFAFWIENYNAQNFNFSFLCECQFI